MVQITELIDQSLQGGGGGAGRPGSLATPTGAFLKQRYSNITWVPPVTTGPQGQPSQEIVPLVRLTTQEVNVSYRWQGFLSFNAGDYDFSVVATNGVRVTVAGDPVIDEVVLAPSRGLTARKTMPAGNSLVVVDWFNPSGSGSVELALAQVPSQSWTSCTDGQVHPGTPPAGWTLTAEGCWKAPANPNAPNTGIDLTKVMVVRPDATSRVERSYVLGSGVGQQPARFRFFNCATNMSIVAELQGPPEVRFVTAFQFIGDIGVGGLPANKFELQPRREMLVDMLFDPTALDNLPEGLNQSTVLVSLSPGTITLPQGGDGQIEVGLCEGITVPTQPTGSSPVVPPPIIPPTTSWRDCSSGTSVLRTGTPPVTWIMRSDGCFIPPPQARPTVTLDFTSTQLADTSTAISRLTGVLSSLRAQLASSLQGDDPTTYTYQWNFDVNRQGSGVGNAAAPTTTVAWATGGNDVLSLQSSLRTTRMVELVATKGSQVLRVRKQVTFLSKGSTVLRGLV